MTELETLERAKMYVDKLANGVNPLNDEPVDEDDIVNNVRISRCLFYVSSVLEKVIGNGGKVKPKKVSKMTFHIDYDRLKNIEYSQSPITVSELVRRINSCNSNENMKKLPYRSVTKWLIDNELLTFAENEAGKSIRRPTSTGEELGIHFEKRFGSNGPYEVVVYDLSAQQFIVDNLEAILANGNTEHASDLELENQGQAWTKNHDECLVELFQKGVPVSEIAVTLQRTHGGIRARLKRLGLIENRSDAK